LSISIGDCGGGTRIVGVPGTATGEPDAIGGVENIIGGGGITDAGELNLLRSQLMPETGVALVNDEAQEEQGSFRCFGSCETSLRKEVGTLCGVSSNTVNFSSEPENARPSKFAIARWYSSTFLTSLARRMRTPGLFESGEKSSLERM
jgi:hypothetical protein